MKDYYRWAKEFSDKHIAPYADEIDREGKFPKEIFDKIAEEGFFKILVPKRIWWRRGRNKGTCSSNTGIC